jgi:hypothetical protein
MAAAFIRTFRSSFVHCSGGQILNASLVSSSALGTLERRFEVEGLLSDSVILFTLSIDGIGGAVLAKFIAHGDDPSAS